MAHGSEESRAKSELGAPNERWSWHDLGSTRGKRSSFNRKNAI